MRVILYDFENFDISHLDRVLQSLKQLELKDGSVSTYEIRYQKEILRYSIFHNKKSFTIQPDRFDKEACMDTQSITKRTPKRHTKKSHL